MRRLHITASIFLFGERKHTNDRQGLKTTYLLLLIKLAAYDDSNITKIDETICFLVLFQKKELMKNYLILSAINSNLVFHYLIYFISNRKVCRQGCLCSM